MPAPPATTPSTPGIQGVPPCPLPRTGTFTQRLLSLEPKILKAIEEALTGAGRAPVHPYLDAFGSYKRDRGPPCATPYSFSSRTSLALAPIELPPVAKASLSSSFIAGSIHRHRHLIQPMMSFAGLFSTSSCCSGSLPATGAARSRAPVNSVDGHGGWFTMDRALCGS
jgi:hypothetical protein